MIKQGKALLSSIKVKLFCWFWLIAILSILTTRFIITQLSNDTLVLPAHEGDLGHLHKISRRINRFQPTDIKYFLENHQKRGRNKPPGPFRPPANIWIKDMATGQLLTSSSEPLPRIENYLGNNNITEITSFQFPEARLTGPVNLNLNKQSYQLYMAVKESRKNFTMLFFSQLPPWARIALPLVVSFAFCWLLARNLSRPLSTMRNLATRLGDGDLTVRVDDIAKRNDELGSLAKSFNLMAHKLELSQAAQQRLLGDVSHELRSPMTRLQMALGLAQKSATSPELLTKHLQRCETEVQRLDEMIADVLSLSRLENALHSLNFTKVNLSGLLDILIQDAQFLADENAITIKTDATKTSVIRGDSQLIASAISNILNNAVKYSPAASTIEVALTKSHNQLNLSVADAGTGVPEQALKELFEPFYRVTEARERQTGGTGLGLAIAKQAVLAHQGKIAAYNNESGGLTVTIQLPLDNAQSKQADVC